MGSIIYQVAQTIFDVYYWLIIIAIIGSWFPAFHSSQIGHWIRKLVEPYLSIFRRFIPPIGMIDFSPLIALIVYRYIGRFALSGLHQLLGLLGI